LLYVRRSLERGRVAATIATVATAAAAIGLIAAPGALAAVSPPKITSAFTPNEIGVGGTTASALSFTIANPNATGTLSAVAFTDALPAGVTVDDPNGENGTCGSSGVITANPGGQTISLTAGSVKAASSCTISVSVVASQTGTFTNNTGVVSSSGGASSTGDTETLTVLPAPTVSFAHIRNNAKYNYGEVVRPTYSCAQAGDPTTLESCTAADDLGNQLNSGSALKTKLPGSHSLTISATSSDGLVTTDTINYTVLPDNRFTVAKVIHTSSGALSFKLSLPGAGKLNITERAGKTALAKYSRHLTGKRTITVHLSPGGSATLPASVALQISYTPTGGKLRTVTKHETL
jgi:hypothetical protein